MRSSLLFSCECASVSAVQVPKLLKLLYQWPGFNEHCDIWTFFVNPKMLFCTHLVLKEVLMVLERGKGLVLIITLTCPPPPRLTLFNVASLLQKCN